MIFEIALACGITLFLYILLKRTLLRWKKKMEEQDEAQGKARDEARNEVSGEARDGEKEEKKGRKDDRPSEE